MIPTDTEIPAVSDLVHHACRLHQELKAAAAHAKANPDHLFNLEEMKRIARMDAAIYAFEDYAEELDS